MNFSTIALLACLTTASGCGLTQGTRKTQEIGDRCTRDRDCDDCAAPVCVIDPFTNIGRCGVASPDSPASTPAPIQLAPGPGGANACCPMAKSVPTDCEVDLLIDLLDVAVSTDHKLAAQWLRLAFHDAGTFDKSINKGGANGCLMTTDTFREEPENGFLDLPIESLLAVKANWEVHPATCLDVSAADMIQFAGFFAAKRQVPPIGVGTTAKKNELKAFEWGRFDEPFCNVDWVSNLPGFRLETPENNIPLRCMNAGSEIQRKMMERNGFTAEESAALIGAHTIGLTRNSFDAGMANPWVPNGADHATDDGPVFDNAFHSFLSNDLDASTSAEFANDVDPFDEVFPDWFQDGAKEMNFLDTDVVLAFPSQDTDVHPNFHLFTDAFANDNALFLSKFFKAMEKMGKLGVSALLSKSTACTTCDGSGSLTTGELSMLVGDLGQAQALAEEDLRVKLNSDELTNQRKSDETPVEKKNILNEKDSKQEIQNLFNGAGTKAEKQSALEMLSSSP